VGWLSDAWYAVKNGTWSFEKVTHEATSYSFASALMPQGTAGIALDMNATNASNGGNGYLVFATNYKDRLPPQTQAIVNTTVGPTGWYHSKVSVTLRGNDDWSGLQSSSYRLDGGAWQVYTGPISIGGDGRHLLQYFSTDRAGNVESTKSLAVLIDSRPPLLTARTNGSLGSAGWYTSPVVVILTASDATSGVAAIRFQLDVGVWQLYSGPITVGDGPHTVSFYSVDAAGNSATVQSIIVKVDTTPDIPW